MFDVDETQIAWYMFASKANSATQAACSAKYPGAAFGLWGFRDDVGRFIPHTFEKEIPLDGLVDDKDPYAQLDLEVTPAKRLIGCTISNLKTKKRETVRLSFGLQQSSDPPWTKKIKGKVVFLEMAKFDAKTFADGPQTKASKSKIEGGVL